MPRTPPLVLPVPSMCRPIAAVLVTNTSPPCCPCRRPGRCRRCWIGVAAAAVGLTRIPQARLAWATGSVALPMVIEPALSTRIVPALPPLPPGRLTQTPGWPRRRRRPGRGRRARCRRGRFGPSTMAALLSSVMSPALPPSPPRSCCLVVAVGVRADRAGIDRDLLVGRAAGREGDGAVVGDRHVAAGAAASIERRPGAAGDCALSTKPSVPPFTLNVPPLVRSMDVPGPGSSSWSPALPVTVTDAASVNVPAGMSRYSRPRRSAIGRHGPAAGPRAGQVAHPSSRPARRQGTGGVRFILSVPAPGSRFRTSVKQNLCSRATGRVHVTLTANTEALVTSVNMVERMARPVGKRPLRVGLLSLRQRIRSQGIALAKMELRASRSS